MTGQEIIYLAIVIALFSIIMLAFWIGNPFSVRVDKGSLSVDGKGRPVKADPNTVSVLKDTTMTDVEAGAITGLRGEPGAGGNRIDLMEGAKITRGKLGDITGQDSSQPAKE